MSWRLLSRVFTKPRFPSLVVGTAAFLHGIGLLFIIQSRKLLKSRGDDRNSSRDDFVIGLSDLHRGIEGILREYRKDEKSYKYFHGHPYQALGSLAIFGDRLSDRRFDEYEIRSFVGRSDRVLDIGCNCGFLSIMTSYRTGCRIVGIDINSYMVDIGKLAAKHLNVSDDVSLVACRIQEFEANQDFDVVFSFATHWTDDRNYRVSIDQHMDSMAGYLKPGGLLLFESHCSEAGRPEFHLALEQVKDRFEFDGMYKKTDNGTREFYVMRRLGGTPRP